YDWNPTIASLARGDVDRDLAEQRDAQAFGFAFAATGAEDVVAFVIRWREEVTHVLDQPQHWHVHLFEHGCGLARIDQRDFLRRGDDDSSRQRHGLYDRQLNVPSARRKIEHQTIQFAPFDRPQKLLRVA